MRNSGYIKFALIFTLAAFHSGNLLAQAMNEPGIDSLQAVLAHMKEDTLKIPVLIKLGQQYEGNRPEIARQYYKHAEQLSGRLGYEAGFVEYVKNYTALLNVQGKFDSSLALTTSALAIARKHGWELEELKLLSNLGAVYQYKEDFQQSLDYYLQSLALMDKLGMKQIMTVTYGNITGLYRMMADLDKAETYARLAVKLAEQGSDEGALARGLVNLANVLKDKGVVTEGMLLLRRSYQIGLKTGDLDIQETSLINLADGYIKLGQPDDYMKAFQKALPLADSLGDVTGTGIILQGFGMAKYHKKLWEEARQALAKALAYSRAHGLKKIEADVLLCAADVQIAMGNLELADGYRDQYDSVRNLLMNEATVKNIQELETRYAVEKNKRELAQQSLLVEEGKRQTQRQHFQFLGAVAGILLLSGVLLFSFRFYRQSRKLNEIELSSLRAEQENLRLKSVLEGETQERRRISQEMHDDLGSGLTSLIFQSRAIPGGKGNEISEGAQTLVRKMNEIIWSMNDEQDSLDSLIAYIRKNAASTLEVAGITYYFEMPENVPERILGQDFRRNVYLAIKEAIHNVVRHARASEVTITIDVAAQLTASIKDNGVGMDIHHTNRFGNGIKNMQRRLGSVGGQMRISSGNGTVIEMTVPWPA